MTRYYIILDVIELKSPFALLVKNMMQNDAGEHCVDHSTSAVHRIRLCL